MQSFWFMVFLFGFSDYILLKMRLYGNNYEKIESDKKTKKEEDSKPAETEANQLHEQEIND